MATPLMSVLKGLALFSRLGDEELTHLAGVARLARYAKGRTLFCEGDPSDTVITIVSGRVKVFKSLPSGNDVILHLLGPGDPVGTVATYEGLPFPASAVALEPTSCLLLGEREFFALIERHPALARGLLAGLTHRLMELTGRIAELTGGQVEPRFARLFLKMADQNRTAGARRHPHPDEARTPGTGRPHGHPHRDRHPHHEPLGKARRGPDARGWLPRRRPAGARGVRSVVGRLGSATSRDGRRRRLPEPARSTARSERPLANDRRDARLPLRRGTARR